MRLGLVKSQCGRVDGKVSEAFEACRLRQAEARKTHPASSEQRASTGLNIRSVTRVGKSRSAARSGSFAVLRGGTISFFLCRQGYRA